MRGSEWVYGVCWIYELLCCVYRYGLWAITFDYYISGYLKKHLTSQIRVYKIFTYEYYKFNNILGFKMECFYVNLIKTPKIC